MTYEVVGSVTVQGEEKGPYGKRKPLTLVELRKLVDLATGAGFPDKAILVGGLGMEHTALTVQWKEET